ncbi:MAG: hypothetical protein Q7U04_08490 [Bacteriovorax sp.]|nr:hypothetical protein [Bacteriovorax sp.]
MRILILSLILITLIGGCSSNRKVKSEIKQDIAKAPNIKTDDELYTIEEKILSANQSLTTDQKTQINSLVKKMHDQNLSIDNDIMKTKSVLFQALVDNSNNKVKLNYLESQLLKLNKKKVRNSLGAFREARNILGKNNAPLNQTLRMLDTKTINEF